jgi:hypothetical protein
MPGMIAYPAVRSYGMTTMPVKRKMKIHSTWRERGMKGTPEEYIAALGQSATKVLNLKYGETVKF